MSESIEYLESRVDSVMLQASLALARHEIQRLTTDKLTLPPGWQAVRISDTCIRINAVDSNGNQCHWILDTVVDT